MNAGGYSITFFSLTADLRCHRFSDKFLMTYVGNLSVFDALLLGSYIIFGLHRLK